MMETKQIDILTDTTSSVFKDDLAFFNGGAVSTEDQELDIAQIEQERESISGEGEVLDEPELPLEELQEEELLPQDRETEQQVRRQSRVSIPSQEMEGDSGASDVAPSATTLNTESPLAMVESLATMTPMDMGRAAPQFNQSLETVVHNKTGQIQEELPSIAQPTGLEPGEGRMEIAYPEPITQEPEIVLDSDAGQTEITIALTLEPEPARAQTPISQPESEEELEQAINQLQIDTSTQNELGPPPTIDLTGSANPTQVEREQQSGSISLENSRSNEVNLFRRDFGENEIYPTIPTEELSSDHEISLPENLPRLETELISPVLSESEEALLNEDMLEEMGQERARVLEESYQSSSEFDQERTYITETNLAEIRTRELEASEEQIRVREENATTISGFRDTHEQESQQILEEYDAEVATARAEHDASFGDELEGATSELEDVFAETEGEVSEREQEAAQRVAEARRQADREKEERTWFDDAVDAVTDFFNDLIDTVTQIVNDLRNWVKQKFNEIKAWAIQKIEEVRRVLVSLIRTFGNFLIRLSNTVLARFPTLRDRFNSFVEQSMTWAENMVNQIAERLKETVVALLDILAAAIDRILEVYLTAVVASLNFLREFVLFHLQIANIFFEALMYRIRQIATLLAFTVFMQGWQLFLATGWHFLGRQSKEYLVNEVLKILISLFESAPDDFEQGWLWPLYVNVQLGNLYEIQSWEMDEKIAYYDKIAGLLISGEFWWNFLLGIFVGIWDNIYGILEGIWMLIRFIFYDMWVLLARVIEIIIDVAPDIYELIKQFNEDVHTFIEELMTTGWEKLRNLSENLSRENIERFFEGLGDDLRTRAQVLGGRVAQRGKEFLLRDDAYATIGMALGRITGYLIVELLLAYFTVGIGTAIKWGLKGVKVAVRFAKILNNVGRAGGMFSRIIRFFSNGVKWLIRAIKKFADKVVKLTGRLLERFRAIFDNLSRKIDDIVAKLTGRRRNVPGDGPDAPRPRPVDGPDGPTPRRRPGDGPNSPRRRRNRDDDPNHRRPRDRDTAREEVQWQAYKGAVRRALMRYERNGVVRPTVMGVFRRITNANRRVARLYPLSVNLEKGWFELSAIKMGGIPPKKVPWDVDKVPLIRAERWQRAKLAIRTRLRGIRENQINHGGLTRILHPFIEDYKFSRLYPEWDERESDWNIMGAMSSAKQLAEVSEFEEIFEDFADAVIDRVRLLRTQHASPGGLVSNEIEEKIIEVWNTNPQKWLKIFNGPARISVESVGSSGYKIIAGLKVTENRIRQIGTVIRKLPGGKSYRDPIDIDWHSGRYRSITLLAKEPNSAVRWDLPNHPPTNTVVNQSSGLLEAREFTVDPNMGRLLKVPLRQRNWPASKLAGLISVDIGISPVNKPWSGKIMHRILSSAPGVRGPGGPSFRTILRNYSFNWKGKEADHVQDLAMNGPDEFHNLWPLARTTNRGTASAIYNKPLTYEDNHERRIISPFGRDSKALWKWYRIKRVIRQ